MRLFYKAPVTTHKSTAARPMSMFASCNSEQGAEDVDVAALARACDATVVSSTQDSRRVLIEANAEQKHEIERQANVTLHVNNQYSVAAMHSAILSAAEATNNKAAGPHPYKFLVESPEGAPISGATVIVSLSEDLKAKAQTDEFGIAHLYLKTEKTGQVAALPRQNYWCTSVNDASTSEIPRKLIVEPLVLPYEDSLAYFRKKGSSNSKNGKGIKVAVIDTGVDQHDDLPKLTIKRTVVDGISTEGACDDNHLSHGTHVAGIIAGSRYGIAPAAELMGYSVFPKDGIRGTAESLDISTAIDFAVDDGAHVINLSLGWQNPGERDIPVVESIQRAVEAGVFVVAATGNDGVNCVMFPASLDEVCAVGAVGANNKFPGSCTHRFYKDRAANEAGHFVAHFSNFEEGKVQTAAPGLAIVSTTQTSGYVAMSGTSMATPVLAGLAARLLSDEPSLLMKHGPARVSALRELLYNRCDNLGFGSDLVGAGVPNY